MSHSTLKEAIESAVNNGCFGVNLTFVEFVSTVEEGQDQFASEVVFAKVILSNGVKESGVSVVIKKQLDNPFTREMMHTDVQFFNEELMYKELLPFLDRNSVVRETFPILFYSLCTLGESFENDILVIEDLKPFGFTLSTDKIFLDFEHVSLALKKLGRFHALSYSSKKENPEIFFKTIAKLKEVSTIQNNDDVNKRFLNISMERGVNPLVEAMENTCILENVLKQIQDPYKLLVQRSLNLVQPEEPLAVICHGDFNRNNMLFKYDDAGKPLDVKFFDLATARYTSPAIDLAFFLFMNTTAVLRRDHWEDFFQIYHDALTGAVSSSRVPSLEDIRREVERKAVYGYFHCSFFIPMMMDNTPKCDLEDFGSLSPEELDEIARTKGGEEATKVITDIVRDLVRFKTI